MGAESIMRREERELYETPLLVDVEETCGEALELAACAICVTGGGSATAEA
jgi:hypothetical protein